MYQNIIPDILEIIFYYYIFEISTDPKYGYKSVIQQINLQEPDMTHMADNLDPEDPDWLFLLKYCHCVDFQGLREEMKSTTDDIDLDSYHADVEYASLILIYCRDQVFKPSFSYVNLWDIHILFLFREDTVHSLRGVAELDTVGLYVPEDYDTHLMDYFTPAEIQLHYDNIRGIKSLNHDSFDLDLTYDCFASLRGIRELTMTCLLEDTLPENAFENLRGIQQLCLPDMCDPIPCCEMFRNLRGVKELELDGELEVDSREEIFQNLRGIHKLCLKSGDACELTEKCFENLRGIEELSLFQFRAGNLNSQTVGSSSLLTDASFQNLRGIQQLELITHLQYDNITDAAFVNLRGVKVLSVRNFPRITSAIFENLRGIEHLELSNCGNMYLTPDTLYNLRGIQHLVLKCQHESLESISRNLLEDECMKHLYGVEILELDNVVTVCDSAFRHFRKTKYLQLRGANQRMENHPLSDSAFSQMPRMQVLSLRNLRLDRVSSFSQLIEDELPALKHLSIYRCVVSRKSLEAPQGATVLLDEIKIHETSPSYPGDCVLASFTFYF